MLNIFKKPNCSIIYNEVRGRHQHKLTDRNENSARYPTFFNGDPISGRIELKLNSRILKHEGINYEYKVLTEFIENREKTGSCPMDEAVKNCTNAKDACEAIRQKMKFLQNQKH